MSTFRVGQRVRLIHRRTEYQIPGGKWVCTPLYEVGVIVRPSNWEKHWFVHWDGGTKSAVLPYQIEPIDDSYDGNQVTTWSTTIWKPSQVRA